MYHYRSIIIQSSETTRKKRESRLQYLINSFSCDCFMSALLLFLWYRIFSLVLLNHITTQQILYSSNESLGWRSFVFIRILYSQAGLIFFISAHDESRVVNFHRKKKFLNNSIIWHLTRKSYFMHDYRRRINSLHCDSTGTSQPTSSRDHNLRF